MKKKSLHVAAVVCLLAAGATAQDQRQSSQPSEPAIVLDVSVVEVSLTRADELEGIGREKGRLDTLVSQGKARPVTFIQLLARSGEVASTRVGQKVPIQTGGSFTASDQSQFRYEFIGLSVDAAPRLLSGGQIEVKLGLEVSLLDKSTGNFTPSFLHRTLKDVVSMRPSETAVLLGILQNEPLAAGPAQPANAPAESPRANFVVLLTARVVD